MTPNKRIKRFIRERTAYWLAALDFEWFEIRHKWVDSGEGDDNVNSQTAADTCAHWQYRYAKIRWYLPNLADQTDKQLDEVLVHELVHCLICSMEQHVPDKFVEQREFAVQTMTRALLALNGRP